MLTGQPSSLDIGRMATDRQILRANQLVSRAPQAGSQANSGRPPAH